ncbi:hypothetical protein [uncultured Alsobacter sp.]|uniref:hypothetical protein n=1 Tax=uncultured Alsobacter sp. TaxID=1748258 RepID=UPI0025EEEEDE|nr:hypothetical protein [uncultured Alsobacter sp.]
MLWYDDSYTSAVPRIRLRAARDVWQSAAGRSEPKAQSARLAAFVGLSQVLQGVADAALAARGLDDETPATGELGSALHALAAVLARPDDPAAGEQEASRLLEALAEDGEGDWRDETIACRAPEGYAFYAVYPEAYADAARRSGLGADTQVIGLRSIGTGLAAMVAAALGAETAATLRPVGQPFDRSVVPGPGLLRRWQAASRSAAFAVVDEGPGASGSSFRAAVRCLEECGVPRDRIHLFPSHANGPGAASRPEWREAWAGFNRHPADIDAFLGLDGAGDVRRLEGWIAKATGTDVRSVRDVSAGRWREVFWPDSETLPPVAPALERRKILAETGRGPVIARFAGLGQPGEDKLALARALAACGFVPEPYGLACGFLVERWQEGARPATTAQDRERILAVLPDYLAARAHLFPGLGRRGASLPALAAMVRRNAAVRFGPQGEAAGAALAARASALVEKVRPICIDGRLDLCEWLVDEGGRVLKADAIDHHDDHSLVGCQDLAWDVAGAAAELHLDTAQTRALCGAIGERGVPQPDWDLVSFYTPCYAASRLAADCLARDMAGPGEEGERLERRADGYAHRLAATLGMRESP